MNIGQRNLLLIINRYTLTSVILIILLTIVFCMNINVGYASENNVLELENEISHLKGERDHLVKSRGQNAYLIWGNVVSDNGSSIFIWGTIGDQAGGSSETTNIEIKNPDRELIGDLGGHPALFPSVPLYRYIETTKVINNYGIYVPLHIYKFDSDLFNITSRIMDIDNKISEIEGQIQGVYQSIKQAKDNAERDIIVNIAVNDTIIKPINNSTRPLYSGAVIIDKKPYVTAQVLRDVMGEGNGASDIKEKWVDLSTYRIDSSELRLRIYINGTVSLRIGDKSQVDRTFTKISMRAYEGLAVFPLEEVSKFFGYSYEWDSDKRIIKLYSPIVKGNKYDWRTPWINTMEKVYEKLPVNGMGDTPDGEKLNSKIDKYTVVINKSINDGTKCEEVYFERGKTYAELGMVKEAMQDFMTILNAHHEIVPEENNGKYDSKTFSRVRECWWQLGLGFEYFKKKGEAYQCYDNYDKMGRIYRDAEWKTRIIASASTNGWIFTLKEYIEYSR